MKKYQNNEIQEIEDIYSEKYDELSDEEKIQLHKMFLNNDNSLSELRNKLKKIIYIFDPPTPEDFLNPDEGWLPAEYIEGLYPYIKEDFIKAMRWENPNSTISIYGSTRTGKTILSILYAVYSTIYVNTLRDPHCYFKINRMSRLVGYMVSFKSEKTKEICIAPILNLLDASKRFVRERFEQNVYKHGIDKEGKIHFSEAGKFGDITFPKTYIASGKDASSLVGSSCFFGTISELTFFKQYVPGITDTEICQVFTKLFTRVQNTVGFGSFPSWVYIDSSSNDSDSPIEKMILEDLRHKENTFFRHYVLWEVRPHLYPKYHKTGETFTVCIGNGSIPAKIIENENELLELPPDLIVYPPIDLYDTFKRNLPDSIRDIAGRPTGSQSKFIIHASFINNIFDNFYLKNVLTHIIADSNDVPEKLIWNQIYDKFFVKTFTNKLEFYRAPKEPRFCGIDTSFAKGGDATGICGIHKEWSKEKNSIIYVIDFCFAILPKEKSINLEAIPQFIFELQSLGNVFIKAGYVDTFQSEALRQNMERKNIEIIKQSVDTSLNPYQFFLTCMANDLIKGGKNIYLKNNLYCLQIMKNDKGHEKIDHPKGTVIHEYNGNWETSQVGINAKDVSDAVCQALWGAKNTDYIPVTCYEDENAKFSDNIKDKQNQIENAFKKFNSF